MNKFLAALASDEFVIEIGFLLPPVALRRRLGRSRAVGEVARAVREGAITEAEVRAFTDSVAAEFRPGFLLPGELTLAAVAVALECCPQEFAEHYLCNLAQLRLSELGTAVRVARECLTARHVRPKNEVRQFTFPDRPRRAVPQSRTVPPRPGVGRWREAGRSRYDTAGA